LEETYEEDLSEEIPITITYLNNPAETARLRHEADEADLDSEVLTESLVAVHLEGLIELSGNEVEE